MKQIFNKEKVLQLREDLDNCIKTNTNIKRKNEYEAVVNQPLYNLDLAAEIAFDDLFVDTAYRNKKIGQKLIKKIIFLIILFFLYKELELE